MRYSKVIMIGLVFSLLTLNGCMLKHVFSDDEGAGMHSGGMHGGGMQHEDMMQSDDEE